LIERWMTLKPLVCIKWFGTVMILAFWVANAGQGLAQGLTRSEATAIALAEAKRLHVVGEKDSVYFSVYDEVDAPVRWKRVLQRDQDLARRLQSRVYWAIYVAPETPGVAVIGGPSVVVFIDVASRTVLGTARLKDPD
jgi:hypothetical protein